MRVHFLASTLARGGAETMAVALSRGLARRGHAVRWSLLREPGDLGASLEPSFDTAHGLAPTRASLLRVDRLCDRLSGDDALYCLDHDNAVTWAAAAAPLAGVGRRVVAVHTTGRWGGRPSLGRAMKAATRAFDAVLALSPTHAAYLSGTEGVPADRIRVVPNGVDPARFADLPSRGEARTRFDLEDDAQVVGAVAMLRPEKNHALLLDAAVDLLPRHPRLRVVCAGEGPERPRLEAAAAALPPGTVRLPGRVEDVPALLAALDVFVLPSLPEVETQPVSVLEAQTAGVPVVATRVGDVATLLEEGAAGILIESGDRAGLAAALGSLLEDPVRRRDLAGRGREVAAGYTLDAAVDGLERVLAGEAA